MLECVENAHSDRDYEVEHVFPEFTCIHPGNALPDFGTVTIQYVPDARCLDTVALKHYLNSFREETVFAHTAVNRILDDLVAACHPRKMSVMGAFTVRGGLSTTVKAAYPGDE